MLSSSESPKGLSSGLKALEASQHFIGLVSVCIESYCVNTGDLTNIRWHERVDHEEHDDANVICLVAQFTSHIASPSEYILCEGSHSNGQGLWYVHKY